MSVRNSTADTVRAVKVVYQFQVLEPWHGPGSLPPADWERKTIWTQPRHVYADLVLPSGKDISLVWAIYDPVKAVRVVSVEMDTKPFRKSLSPLETMALRELTGIPDVDLSNLEALPEAQGRQLQSQLLSQSFWKEHTEKKNEIADRLKREDPERLEKMLFASPAWFNDALISPSLDGAILKSLTTELDPPYAKRRKMFWDFEEIPITLGLERQIETPRKDSASPVTTKEAD